MTERERLIKDIINSITLEYDGQEVEPCVFDASNIADFIISRDKQRYGASVTLEALKANPQYSHIDIDSEFNKAKQWIARTGGRKLTPKFFVNWLNRIEKPLDGKKIEKEAF